jgi:Spaetzle
VCNFTYHESILNYPEKLIDTLTTKLARSKLGPRKINDSRPFHCDDGDDAFWKKGTTVAYDVNSRFGTTSKEAMPISDAHEVEETLCESHRQVIFPKTLPNILNKMVIIVNHGQFKQEVNIEKCR